MSKPKLYLDFDNTIVDTIAAIVSLYNEDFSSKKGFIPVDPKNVTSWEFKECVLATYADINNYFKEERFFKRLRLYPCAGQVLRSLSHRYDITIVSHGYPSNLTLKEKWVNDELFARVFSNECTSKFIGVNWEEYSDKSHINMSDGIFVDDSVKNLKSSNAKYKILYGEYMDWNKTNLEFIRCRNWMELNEQIKLLEVYSEGDLI